MIAIHLFIISQKLIEATNEKHLPNYNYLTTAKCSLKKLIWTVTSHLLKLLDINTKFLRKDVKWQLQLWVSAGWFWTMLWLENTTLVNEFSYHGQLPLYLTLNWVLWHKSWCCTVNSKHKFNHQAKMVVNLVRHPILTTR